ncbi:MAG: pyridoxamine 5'-phosphate oxidase family protein [Acidimicrobiales bacterium]
MRDTDSYPETRANQPSRHRERARYDRGTVHSILDGGIIAHVGFVAGGRPQVLPMLYVRVGEAIYLHGSTGAHLNRLAARNSSLPMAVEVTLLDELVLARSVFDHSANYRSVVVSGEATVVTGERRKTEVLEALVEKLIPGRSSDARPPSGAELRQTALLELELNEVSAKVRTGDPIDEAADLASSCWAGVLPVHTTWGEARRAANLAPGIELPGYLGPAARPVIHFPG